MKINIEKYLKDHHDKFDIEQTDEDLIWEGIRPHLQGKKEGTGIHFWKAAAILLAIFSFSYVIFNELSRDEVITLSQIDKAIGEKEKAYQLLVMDKMQAANIQHYSADPEYEIIHELIKELTVLDDIYDEAMKDLNQHGYMEQIVEIIFDTYEKRIRILEQIIKESQKIELNGNDTKNIRL